MRMRLTARLLSSPLPSVPSPHPWVRVSLRTVTAWDRVLLRHVNEVVSQFIADVDSDGDKRITLAELRAALQHAGFLEKYFGQNIAPCTVTESLLLAKKSSIRVMLDPQVPVSLPSLPSYCSYLYHTRRHLLST